MADDFTNDPRRSSSSRVRGDSERAIVTPAIETTFDVLQDRERRLICTHVADREEDVFSLDTLTALLEEKIDRDDERIRIDLHHRHLPKLERAGLVEYDARSNTVRYHGQPSVEKWAEHAAYLEEEC